MMSSFSSFITSLVVFNISSSVVLRPLTTTSKSTYFPSVIKLLCSAIFVIEPFKAGRQAGSVSGMLDAWEGDGLITLL